MAEYKYETHLHTKPVSKCAVTTVEESLKFYKQKGYDGVFVTNHFLDGNIGIYSELPYEERIEFYCSDYEEAKKLESEIGIKVFFGVELAFPHMLVYGIDKAWFLAHKDFDKLTTRQKLDMLNEAGAFIVQAHPFREESWIDHVALYPNDVSAIEVINSGCKELWNKMAKIYADNYNLPQTAGTDMHNVTGDRSLGVVKTKKPINSVKDYIDAVKNREVEVSLETQ